MDTLQTALNMTEEIRSLLYSFVVFFTFFTIFFIVITLFIMYQIKRENHGS